MAIQLNHKIHTAAVRVLNQNSAAIKRDDFFCDGKQIDNIGKRDSATVQCADLGRAPWVVFDKGKAPLGTLVRSTIGIRRAHSFF